MHAMPYQGRSSGNAVSSTVVCPEASFRLGLRLFRIAGGADNPALNECALVQAVAWNQLTLQCASCPLSKGNATLGLRLTTERKNDIKISMVNVEVVNACRCNSFDATSLIGERMKTVVILPGWVCDR